MLGLVSTKDSVHLTLKATSGICGACNLKMLVSRKCLCRQQNLQVMYSTASLLAPGEQAAERRRGDNGNTSQGLSQSHGGGSQRSRKKGPLINALCFYNRVPAELLVLVTVSVSADRVDASWCGRGATASAPCMC